MALQISISTQSQRCLCGTHKIPLPLHTHVWGPGKLKVKNIPLPKPEKCVIRSEIRVDVVFTGSGGGYKSPFSSSGFLWHHPGKGVRIQAPHLACAGRGRGGATVSPVVFDWSRVVII